MDGRVLIVDDDEDLRDLLEVGLRSHGFAVVTSASAEGALALLRDGTFDVVVTDIKMPGIDGIEFCRQVVSDKPGFPVVVMTAFANVQTAVSAIRAGAYDFILKPIDVDAMAIRLERVARDQQLREQVKQLTRAVEATQRFEELIGSSTAMQDVYDLLSRIAESEASVLVTGESGTGKEVVARALHRRGARSKGPFVALNCSAVPENLLESELFGHTRGAFTDARHERAGLFTQASGGTLFLDEIGDMPLTVQPKLLRALEERVIRPVGSDEETPVDVRVIAATNRDLESAVEEGQFREALLYRINVIRVDLPPLRARGGDVLLLAQSFLSQFAEAARKQVTGLSPEAAERLLAYDWPGNVRELRNCLERAVAFTRYREIAVEDLPAKVRDYTRSHVLIAGDDPTELAAMEEVERRYIARVMEAVGGNKTLAAKILGFDRKTLYRKLERYSRGASRSA